MNSALLLLVALSVRGRIVRMVRRLRSPRYLIGFVVGVAWLWLWFGRGLFGMSSRGNIEFGLPEEALQALAGPIGDGVQLAVSLLLTLALTVWWLIPLGKSSLEFTEPELNLLLPAPVPRRHLIQYSLLRSQPAIMLGAGFMSLMTGGPFSASGFGHWLGLWMFFTIWDLHSRGRGLWLARLAELPPAAAWRRRLALWSGLLVLWVGLLLAVSSLVVTVLETPWPATGETEAFDDVRGQLGTVGQHLVDTWLPSARDGLLGWLLAPMLWLTQPFFLGFHDTDLLGRLAAWIAPLMALALHHEWVVRSQVRFEESAMEHAQRQSRQLDPAARFWKRSQWSRRQQPFALRSSGHTAVAVLWKNLMLAVRLPLTYTAAMLAGIGGLALAYLASGLAPTWQFGVVGSVALSLPVISPLIAVRGLRYDFRCDLLKLELIRPWPIRGWQLFLAEVSAPIALVMLPVVIALATVVGVDIVAAARGVESLERLRGTAAGALGVAPPLVVPLAVVALLPISLVLTVLTASIENLAALLFPGWMHLGLRKRQAAAHFGQDLIVFFVLSLAILVGMAPGAVLVGVVLLVQVWFWQVPIVAWELPLLSLAAVVPIGAVIAALVMFGGRIWETLDPSEELLAGGGG